MSRGLRIGFVVLMLALTLLFAGLGYWQVERLGEKEQLVAAVTAGMDQPPLPLPPAADLQPAQMQMPASGAEADSLVYRALTVTGTWRPADTVLVFTSLGDPRGAARGPGYWVLTPLALTSGGTLYVNRGFVPQDQADQFRNGGDLPGAEVTLSGIGLPAETVSAFTPAANLADRIDWVRNPERLAAFAADLPQPVLPLYLDLPAGAPGELPQGGETVVEFPNNHLGYAMTWFGFALITPVLLAFWLRRNRRRTV